MAINRYTQFADSQVTPSVLPIPYQALMQQGRVMQDNYDLGAAAKQTFLEKLAKSEFREEDRADFERINQKYEQGLNQIAEEVGKDYGSNTWKEKFDMLAKTLQADFTQGDLYAMQKNADALKEWNKRKADFKESPYKEYLDESFQSVGNYKGYRNPDGTYNITSVGNIDKFLERDKKADEIVKGIAANGTGGFSTKTDKYGNVYITDSKGETVSPEKISQTFLPLFTNSEEFGQMKKEAEFLAQTQGIDANQYLKESVGDLLAGVTAKYGYKKSESNLKIHGGQQWQHEANLAESTYTPTANGAAFGNTSIVPLPGDASDRYNKEKGFHDFLGEDKPVQVNHLLGDRTWEYKGKEISEKEAADFFTQKRKEYDVVNKQIVSNQFKNIQRTGEFANEEEYKKAYRTASKDAKNVTLRGDQLGPDQATYYQNILDRNEASQLYNIPGEGMLSKSEIAEKYDVSADAIEIKPNLVHWDSPDKNSKGGSLEVSINIKEGKNKSKIIPAVTPLNDNFTAETSLLSEIGQNSLYQGVDTYTQDRPKPANLFGENVRIYTTTTPKKQYAAGKEYPFNTKVHIEYEDGEKDEIDYLQFREIVAKSTRKVLKSVAGSGTQTLSNKDLKRVEE